MVRKLAIGAVVIAVAVVAATGTAAAARGGGHERGAHRGGEGIFRGLNVTEAQRRAIRQARESSQGAVRTAKERLRNEVRALREVMAGEPTDAQITAALRRVETAHDGLQAAQKAQRKAIADVLTPTQRARWVLKVADQMRHAHAAQRGGEGWRDEGRQRAGRQGGERREGWNRGWRSPRDREPTW